jgi:hypothetical protein
MKHQTILPSQSTLLITLAPLAAAGKLRRTLAKEFQKVELSLSPAIITAVQTRDTRKILAAFGDAEINCLKDLVMQVLGSEDLENAVFDCLAWCTLNGEKITKATFEPEAARADLLPAAWEVIQVNLLPFFASLISTSSIPPAGAK